MIDAKDLRIGNWVLDNKTNKLIHFKSFFGLANVENRNDEFSPIPLTPEILEKCGFENWDKNKYSNDAICLTVNGDGFLYLANQRNVNIFHLHELQNLYYALTKQELNYQP